MYCKNCGEKVQKSAKYCVSCGAKITSSEKENTFGSKTHLSNDLIPTKTNKIHLSEEEKYKLEKAYNLTGNLSIIRAVGAFTVAMFIGFELRDLITDAIVAFIVNAPFFYFGLRLKQKGINDLLYAKKLSLGMLIFSIVWSILNLFSGFTGWIWSILIYFYFNSYRQTKIVIDKHTAS